MPRKSRKQDNPSVESILQDCYTLSISDMMNLREALDVLIAEEQQRLEMEPDEWEMKREEKISKTGARGSRGSIELKMINRCGPYAYLRFRSGDVHHSFYLGKAKTQ
ncbi:hypothetical protein ACQ4M3_33360 [Leptolyngbya sp. AN03gr2]|uniref:hypothetical protein n=1 Tax=unclassified Leptolyngbya TaxID=2650499 RepID=UPI003D3201FD